MGTRSRRWLAVAPGLLLAIAIGFVVWGLQQRSAASDARGDLASAEGAYQFAELGEPANPTLQQAATITPNDIVLANAQRRIWADQASITTAESHMRIAFVIAGVMLAGAILLFGFDLRAHRTQVCPSCRRRVHRAAAVCPNCQRELPPRASYPGEPQPHQR